jgi:pre-rRNA-processing protein TSR4
VHSWTLKGGSNFFEKSHFKATSYKVEMSDESDVEDFSDEEEVGGTSVLLGYADKPIGTDAISALDSHLGGQPAWFDGIEPDLELVKCKSCKQLMPLLVQIYAPLEGVYYDRALYVFACKKPQCRRKIGTIRAIRGIKRDSAKEEAEMNRELEEQKRVERETRQAETKQIGTTIGDQIFASDPTSNPFGSNPFSSSTPSNASPANEKGKEKPAKQEPAQVSRSAQTRTTTFPAFPGYLMQVESEYLSPRKIEPIKGLDSSVLDNDSGESSRQDTGLGRAVEAANLDATFQKFVDLVDNNPDQVVRYERPGTAVLYSSKDDISDWLDHKPYKIPNCPLSGGARVLELQIMPHTIMVLEEYEEDLMNGMEWGTIFVATSDTDTMPSLNNGVGYTEEWAGVQWEEVVVH